jgi:hypothetical protein
MSITSIIGPNRMWRFFKSFFGAYILLKVLLGMVHQIASTGWSMRSERMQIAQYFLLFLYFACQANRMRRSPVLSHRSGIAWRVPCDWSRWVPHEPSLGGNPFIILCLLYEFQQFSLGPNGVLCYWATTAWPPTGIYRRSTGYLICFVAHFFVQPAMFFFRLV